MTAVLFAFLRISTYILQGTSTQVKVIREGDKIDLMLQVDTGAQAVVLQATAIVDADRFLLGTSVERRPKGHSCPADDS